LIIQQGAKPDGVYFVKDGTVVVQKEVEVVQRNRWPVKNQGGEKNAWEVKESTHPRRVNLVTIKEGGYFGEAGVISCTQTRLTAVRAVTNVCTLFITKEDFLRFIHGSRSIITYLQERAVNYCNDMDVETKYREQHGVAKRSQQKRREAEKLQGSWQAWGHPVGKPFGNRWGMVGSQFGDSFSAGSSASGLGYPGRSKPAPTSEQSKALQRSGALKIKGPPAFRKESLHYIHKPSASLPRLR
jgi:hypothetical protein